MCDSTRPTGEVTTFSDNPLNESITYSEPTLCSTDYANNIFNPSRLLKNGGHTLTINTVCDETVITIAHIVGYNASCAETFNFKSRLPTTRVSWTSQFRNHHTSSYSDQ